MATGEEGHEIAEQRDRITIKEARGGNVMGGNVMSRLVYGAAAVAAVFAWQPASAQVELLFNSFAGPQHILTTRFALPWARAVEEATEGRVKFKIPPNSLAPPPDQLDMVEQGIADVAYIFNAFLVKRAPLVQVSLLPLVYESAEANAVALWRTHKRFFEAKGEFKNVEVVGFIGGPGGDMFSLKDQPITSLETLKKMKMWSLPGTPAKALGVLGVTVVPGPAVRMFEIISSGTVDGISGVSPGDAERFKVDRFVKSVTVIPGKVFAPSFAMFINGKKWAGLSPKDRAAILAVSGEKLARLSRNWDEEDRGGEERYRAAGRQVLVAPPAFLEELKKAWLPLHDEWVAEANKQGIDGKAALAYYLEQVKAVAAERR